MNIVLAIPHSVREVKTQWIGNIDQDADRWTDWHTDRVFGSKLPFVSQVVGNVSRFDCDLERLENDPLEKEGQGILYTSSESGATREITETQKEELLSEYHSYRKSLSEALTEGDLLIDCHSFPSDLSDKDICIGFNDDWSKPNEEVIETIKNHFLEQGYSVGINDPYSNSITPKTNFKYSSVMIELNKKIYFNEKTLQEFSFSYKVHNSLNRLYKKIKNL